MKKIGIALAITLALPFFAPALAHADDHPAYLHALSDLREARGLLERPSDFNGKVKWKESEAIGEIDKAIGEIKKASIDDGKDVADHPAPDTTMHWGGRLKHARELLKGAEDDITKREGNYEAKGLRKRAFMHIDNAIRDIKRGENEIHD
jgi:hypothetical protein